MRVYPAYPRSRSGMDSDPCASTETTNSSTSVIYTEHGNKGLTHIRDGPYTSGGFPPTYPHVARSRCNVLAGKDKCIQGSAAYARASSVGMRRRRKSHKCRGLAARARRSAHEPTAPVVKPPFARTRAMIIRSCSCKRGVAGMVHTTSRRCGSE